MQTLEEQAEAVAQGRREMRELLQAEALNPASRNKLLVHEATRLCDIAEALPAAEKQQYNELYDLARRLFSLADSQGNV